MDRITLRACGKLNLSLDIVGVREDGYHLMDMVMQSVSGFRPGDGGEGGIPRPRPLPLRGTGYRLPGGKSVFRGRRDPGGARAKVEKQIPSEAGMAGGSADGAAVLVALDRLYGTGMGEKLVPIGEKVGADVPFCLTGGTARVEGIGERVTPLPFFDRGCYLVVKPPFGISTPAAFRAFDRSDAPPPSRHRRDDRRDGQRGYPGPRSPLGKRPRGGRRKAGDRGNPPGAAGGRGGVFPDDRVRERGLRAVRDRGGGGRSPGRGRTVRGNLIDIRIAAGIFVENCI